MATTSLSLLPSSISFSTDRPSTSASSFSSSSSTLFHGATSLRSHKSFSSLTSSSSLKSNPRFSKNRFGTVLAASGDYYSTLGVPKSASSKEIKAAYRRLARQVLPLIGFFIFGWSFLIFGHRENRAGFIWYIVVECPCLWISLLVWLLRKI